MYQSQVVAHITEIPVIQISAGIVHVRHRSGAMPMANTMSVKMLAECVDRCRRALDRYAAGEQDVIEGH